MARLLASLSFAAFCSLIVFFLISFFFNALPAVCVSTLKGLSGALELQGLIQRTAAGLTLLGKLPVGGGEHARSAGTLSGPYFTR